MLQEIIVYIIGIAVAILLINKVCKGIFGKKKQGLSGCSSCGCRPNNYRVRS